MIDKMENLGGLEENGEIVGHGDSPTPTNGLRTCGTIHTENLLKTDKSPQDYDGARTTLQN